MRNTQIKVYEYSELSDASRSRARAWLMGKLELKEVEIQNLSEVLDTVHGLLVGSTHEFTINGEWWEGK